RQLVPAQPVETDGGEADIMRQLLDAEREVEQPSPGQPGDDERHRERIEEHRAQHVLGAHALVDQCRQQEAECQCGEQKERPNTARLPTDTSQRWLSARLAYCRNPTNTELGSIRELVNEIQTVQPVDPQYTTSAISIAGTSATGAATREPRR